MPFELPYRFSNPNLKPGERVYEEQISKALAET
jgi:hypothetical protein